MKYYDLRGTERWLDPDTPEEIGGRDTDISQLGISLYARVREAYPINEVPQEIVSKAVALRLKLEEAEKELRQLIEAVSADVARRNRHP